MAYDTDTEPYEDDAPNVTGSPDDALHERAIIQFDQIISAVQEERALALVDRRFVTIAGAQWEGGWAQQFQNSIMVEINKTAQGVEKIITDYRSNRKVVDFRAVDKDASEDTADVLNGMFRADMYWSHGQEASDNGFDEAVMGGMGAWMILPKYEDEYDPDNDRQRICFEAIPDADQSVFWDPNAKLYDKSDAEYCFVITAMGQQAFYDRFGEDKAADWPVGIFKAYYEWYTPDVVMVARYFDYVTKSGDRLTLEHAATGETRKLWASDLESGELDQMIVEGWRLIKRRRAKRRQVRMTVMSGAEILEAPRRIAGDYIPVIPVYGKRWFVDNMERSRGHARFAKDAQRVLNVQFSKLTEMAAVTPIERPIFTPEQVAGHEDSWAEGNIRRLTYQLINPIVNEQTGEKIIAPVTTLKPPDMPPVLGALLQITDASITSLVSADDGADEVKANVSAEAMDIAATRTDSKSEIYLDNMGKSWQRCGEIYLPMAREVYFEEAREVETMDDAGQIQTATLYQGVSDQKTGAYRVINDLQRGTYKVFADVTEATSTRRDKTVKNLVNIATVSAATDPDLANAALTTAVLNMDGEGIDDLQDYLRKKALLSGLVKPTDQEKAELEQAMANQQPDPQAQLAGALAEKEGALAKKAQADTVKSMADAELSRAKTASAYADANRAQADAGHTRIETIHAVARGPEPHAVPAAPAQAATARRVGVFNHIRGLLTGAVSGLSA